MADTAAKVEATSAVVALPKVKKTAAAKSAADKKPRVKVSHPPTAEMVNIAIGTLKERGGSSLQAIKKYLAANYQTDSEKIAPFIKKYLKSAVTTGSLIQVKGKGASGSFKLAAPAKKVKAVKKPADKIVKKVKSTSDKKKVPKSPKKKSAASPKKSPTKKSTVEKKKIVVKVAAAAKKTTTVKAKSPKEKVAKTPVKTVVKKPKTVNTKKVTAPTPKKAAAPAKKPVAKK